MGLTGSFIVDTVKGSTTFTKATIQSFGGNASNINLSVFFSDTTDDDMAAGAMKNFNFEADLSADASIIEQGYAYLKTLPIFKSAV